MPSGSASCPIGQHLLAQGQSLFEHMPRGAVIRVASGSVVLVQRTLLDDGLLVHRMPLSRGAVHCVQVSGWLEIRAQSEVALELRVPQPVSLLRMLAWLVKVLPRWTVQAASAAPRPGRPGGATAAVARPPAVCSLG